MGKRARAQRRAAVAVACEAAPVTDAGGAGEGSVRGPETVADALERLEQLVVERDRLASDQAELVRLARAGGATWPTIAAALGVSPQAVQKRYGGTDGRLQDVG